MAPGGYDWADAVQDGVDPVAATDRTWTAETARRQQEEQGRERAAAAGPAPFGIIAADAGRWIGKVPEPIRFTIAELVPEGMVTLLVAPGGSGKTLLAQMAVTCIAADRPFLGRFTLSGRAAGIFGEDPETVLHVRQTRICAALQIDLTMIAGRCFVLSVAGSDAVLWRDGHPTPRLVALEEELAGIRDLRLVVLDNAALLFSGNENDWVEVTHFLNALNGLASRLKVGLVLVTHASKSQDGSALRVASGSTAWVNASRSVLELLRETEDEGPRLVVVKANHAATGTTIPLEWRDGVLIAPAAKGGLVDRLEGRQCEAAFLEALAKLRAEGRDVSAKKAATNYAPRMMVRVPMMSGWRKAQIEQAMESLLAAGRIVQAPFGPPSKGFSRLEIVPDTQP